MNSAVLNTEFGEIGITHDGWGLALHNSKNYNRYHDIQVRLSIADDGSAAGFEIPRQVFNTTEGVSDIQRLIACAAWICDLFLEANAETIEQLKREEEEAELERKRLAEEREAELELRRERLMTEFLGDEVKIRERGYKTMRRARVEVYSTAGAADQDYRLHFRYFGRDERTQNLERMVRVDIKVGSRWKTLWDDGKDDLSPWEQRKMSTSAAEVEMYDGELGGEESSPY
jgi:hypothetical protein